MNFATANEASDGYERKLYTGIENFKVTHVNPTHEQLKEIYGENAKEPVYLSTDEDGNKRLRFDFYIDNVAEEDEPSIKTKFSLFMSPKHTLSQTDKYKYLNKFGQFAWLPKDGTVPENMSWFVEDGKRKAYDGEEEVIGFLRNILNLPSHEKAKQPSDAESLFSEDDITKFFSGDFSGIRDIVLSSPNKIGLLLGVKRADNGNLYQDVFTRVTLRQYSKNSKKFDYIRKNVMEAQENGAYPNTDFGNIDYVLREYLQGESTPTNEAALKKEPEDAEAFGGGFV